MCANMAGCDSPDSGVALFRPAFSPSLPIIPRVFVTTKLREKFVARASSRPARIRMQKVNKEKRTGASRTDDKKRRKNCRIAASRAKLRTSRYNCEGEKGEGESPSLSLFSVRNALALCLAHNSLAVWTPLFIGENSHFVKLSFLPTLVCNISGRVAGNETHR